MQQTGVSGGGGWKLRLLFGRSVKQEIVNWRGEKEHLKIAFRSYASPVSSAACWVVLHLMSQPESGLQTKLVNRQCKYQTCFCNKEEAIWAEEFSLA